MSTFDQVDDMFEGEDDVSIDDIAVEPEVKLYLAIIVQAWTDAFVESDSALFSSDKRQHPDAIRGEARRWLTLDHGAWREDREEICARAGVDPDLVRAAALRRLEKAKVEDIERRENERVAIDAAFDRLVEIEAEIGPRRARQRLRSLILREERLA